MFHFRTILRCSFSFRWRCTLLLLKLFMCQLFNTCIHTFKERIESREEKKSIRFVNKKIVIDLKFKQPQSIAFIYTHTRTHTNARFACIVSFCIQIHIGWRWMFGQSDKQRSQRRTTEVSYSSKDERRHIHCIHWKIGRKTFGTGVTFASATTCVVVIVVAWIFPHKSLLWWYWSIYRSLRLQFAWQQQITHQTSTTHRQFHNGYWL